VQWTSSETRIRRSLRDPDAKVYPQELLIDLWNQAQDQFNKDTRLHIRVQGVHVPGLNNYTRTYEWEEEYLEGAVRRFGENYDATGYFHVHEWEAPQIRGFSPQDDPNSYRATHSWEIYTVSGVNDWDILKFPNDFDKAILVAYDRQRLSPVTEETLQRTRRSYKTNAGRVTDYCLIGQDQEREFALYPRPSDYTVTTIDDAVSVVDCGYTHSWESTSSHLPSDAKSPGKITDNSNDYEAIYRWEVPFADGDANPDSTFDFGGYYESTNHDVEMLSISNGMIISVDADEATTEEGTFYRWDGDLVDDYYGIMVDYVSLDNNVLVVYYPRVSRIADPTDDIELWLDWQVKYIERLTISLAFLCNNNRYNTSMSKFWKLRYQDGLQVMRKYRAKRTENRRVALKSYSVSGRHRKGLVDLPDEYPSAWR
jgi:hypothetical protein